MRKIGLQTHWGWLLCIKLIECFCDLCNAIEPLLLFEECFASEVVLLHITKFEKQPSVIKLIGVTPITDHQVMLTWQPHGTSHIWLNAFISLRLKFIVFLSDKCGILSRIDSTTNHSPNVYVWAEGDLAKGTLLAKNLTLNELLLILQLYLICLW